MPRYFTFIFLFLYTGLIAQQIEVSGLIKDSKTGKIIPFATIEIMGKGIGVAANYEGKFHLQLLQNSLDDSVRCSSLGYKTSVISIQEIMNNATNLIITLSPVVYTLKEVEIFGPTAGTYRLGNFIKLIKRHGGLMTHQKSQIAVFMDSHRYPNSKILNVAFNITKYVGKPTTPFRVRIYSRDLLTGNPGEDLLKENIIVHGRKKGGWLIVDLSKFNLKAPSDGYFAAMEWIDSGPDYIYKFYIEGKLCIEYGQVCTSTAEIETSNSWEYNLGKGWKKTEKGQKYLDYPQTIPNALIYSEIGISK